uniref:site-specific DNA-methyltransferase (adenine-specific) n=1 Tax=Leptospirillum sp. Group II '5-way CG' TaxID=419541 RepID=B6ASD1_9BACT|nr:MAG: superfamily II DNA/RNA helicase [Leptospirillum sp. Group II '5-way CG']
MRALSRSQRAGRSNGSAISVTGGLFSAEFFRSVRDLSASYQSGSEYGIPRGLNLRDEIGRWWRIAQGEWGAFKTPSPQTHTEERSALSRRWVDVLFRDILQCQDLSSVPPIHLKERLFPITYVALGKSLPIVAVPASHSLDQSRIELGDGHRKRSPHGLLQEYLNTRSKGEWGIVTNGRVLRLLRENPSLTRPVYVEIDLERILTEELYSDFALFCLLCHRTRFESPSKGGSSVLEHWKGEAQETGERALEKLREGVRKALEWLGRGFLAYPSNHSLRESIQQGKKLPDQFHQELLRLVYRFLFLLTVEDRNLLHESRVRKEAIDIYQDGYSLSRLRILSRKRRAYDRFPDLWKSLQIVFGGLRSGASDIGLAPLGGLFSEDQCSLLETSEIDNAHLLSAIREIAYFETGDTLARINYRDMDTEELGSVYESLLELHPVIRFDRTPWTFGFVGFGDESGNKGASSSGSQRKSTGSYYTPDSLVRELIGSALEPVIKKTLEDHPDYPRKALLALRIIDPSCGSGHFLLSAARRLALEVARIDADSETPDEATRRHALREVVQHTIFGVDINPLAVELCRTALWLETVEPGKPLGFLDNHILCGNSLVGLLSLDLLKNGIPKEAYVALSGDDPEIVRQIKARNKPGPRKAFERIPFKFEKSPHPSPEETDLDLLPEDTLEEIANKKRLWNEQQALHQGERLAADLFVSAFFLPKTPEYHSVIPVTDDLNRLRSKGDIDPPMQRAITEAARTFQFFHWPIMFPEIFAKGGFDVVLGNPPWKVIELSEEKYFTNLSPDISQLIGIERKNKVKALKSEDPFLWNKYLLDKRSLEASSIFFHNSSRYQLVCSGKMNLYALFSETVLKILHLKGFAGIVVPTGIATDDTAKDFFDHLIQNDRLVSLYDFENREGLFPAVHSKQRISLFTMGRNTKPPDFLFFATNTDHLQDERRRYSLSGKEIRLFNPNTGTTPTFRTRVDAELTRKIYEKAGVFIREDDEHGNPWGVKFRQGLFNMTSDSGHFQTYSDLIGSGATFTGMTAQLPNGLLYLPLYEAKMVHYYDHRWATYDEAGKETREVTDLEKANAEFQVRPRYWVPEKEVDERIQRVTDSFGKKREWLLGWRDIARSTDERTVIAGVIPRVGSGDTFLLIFLERSTLEVTCLISNISSISFDYASRQKVGGTHLKYFTMKQLPIFPPEVYSKEDLEFVSNRVLELVYVTNDLTPFARDLGYEGPPFPWDSNRRAMLRAELDAFYAKKYGLNRQELEFILDPADVYGEDFPSVTFPGLKKNELREFGEYRTKRLVLEAWENLFEG